MINIPPNGEHKNELFVITSRCACKMKNVTHVMAIKFWKERNRRGGDHLILKKPRETEKSFETCIIRAVLFSLCFVHYAARRRW